MSIETELEITEWQQIRLLRLADEVASLIIGEGLSGIGRAPNPIWTARSVKSSSMVTPRLQVVSQYRGRKRGWEQISFTSFYFKDEEFDLKVESRDEPAYYEDPFTEYAGDLIEKYMSVPEDLTIKAYGTVLH